MAQTRDALKILEKVTGNSEAVKTGIAQAKINFEVAQMIYDARTKAGLSQSELAALIGSKQPVIARLEDADYEGHSLTHAPAHCGEPSNSAWSFVSYAKKNRAKRRSPSPVPSRRRKLAASIEPVKSGWTAGGAGGLSLLGARCGWSAACSPGSLSANRG